MRTNILLWLLLIILGSSPFTFAANNFDSKNTLEKNPSPTDQSMKSSTASISTFQYVSGGVVGTIYGLGTGHLIQGRYSKLGWIFTLSEIVTLSIGFWGMTNSISYFNSDSNSRPYYGFIGGASLLGFAGLKIWEIIDLWTGISPNSGGTKQTLSVIPSKEGTQLAYSWHF